MYTNTRKNLVLLEGLEPRCLMSASLGANLIQNPGAEIAAPLPASSSLGNLSNWTRNGKSTTVAYGTSGGFPSASTPGPANRGKSFFAGGTSSPSDLFQTVDLSVLGAMIDGGTVKYDLGAWLGGYGNQNDSAQVIVGFENAYGGVFAQASIGPVTAANRSNKTSFIFREAIGSVPVGARFAQMQVHFVRTSGSYNDGYADNLSLVMNSTAPVAPQTPTGLTANVIGTTAVSLNWSAPAGADHFIVEEWTAATGWFRAQYPTGGASSAIVQGLAADTDYQFAVRAAAADGTISDHSNIVLCHTFAPTADAHNVVAYWLNATTLRISWQYDGLAQGFLFENSSGTQWITSVSGTSRQCDFTLASGSQFAFRLLAQGQNGQYSGGVAVTNANVQSPDVYNVGGSWTADGKFNLHWNYDGTCSEFLIEVMLPGQDWQWFVPVSASQRSITIGAVPFGAGWQFRVLAHNLDGSFSAGANAVTT